MSLTILLYTRHTLPTNACSSVVTYVESWRTLARKSTEGVRTRVATSTVVTRTLIDV